MLVQNLKKHCSIYYKINCSPSIRLSLVLAQMSLFAVVKIPIDSAMSAPSSAISVIRASCVNKSSSLSLE